MAAKAIFQRAGVRNTSELQRVKRLPRRVLGDEDLNALAVEMSAVFAVPGSDRVLRGLQAASLRDLHDFGGLVAAIRVGGGKTDLSFLAGSIVEAERVLLLVPAALEKKTKDDFKILEKHWVKPKCIKILSYQKLSRADREQEIMDFKPDLLIGDEAQWLKSRKAAVTRRVGRYLKAYPDTKCVFLSGTITKRSLENMSHLMMWAFGEERSPLPTRYDELFEWCLAVDEKLPRNRVRLNPGALIELYNGEEASISLSDTLKATRRAVGRRIEETPGVVTSGSDVVPNGLVFDEFKPEWELEITQALQLLHSKWELPDGQQIMDAPSIWRHERELSLGFYYRWIEQPPPEWMEARRVWASNCRQTLKNNRRGLDTEAQLAAAIVRGEYQGDEVEEAYQAWVKIREVFDPKTEAVWLTDGVLKEIGYFVKTKTAPLVWVEHRAVGHKLSELFGWPYHGQKAQSSDGKSLADRSPADGPLIVSIASCGTGFNLQAWFENVIVTSPANGSTHEQLTGRTHRDGQEADEVEVTVVMSSNQSRADFWQAVADARYVEAMTGSPQKLTMATILIGEP